MKKSYGSAVLKKPKNFSQRCLFLISCAFFIVFLLLYFGICFFNVTTLLRYNMWLAAAAGAVVFILLVGITRFLRSNRHIRGLFLKHNVIIFIAGLITLFAVQCLFDIALYRQVGWDAGIIVGAAVNKLDLKGDYFSVYPNNLMLLCILHVFIKIGHFLSKNVWLFLSIINTAFVDFAIACTFFAVRKLWGITAGFISFILSILLFGFSIWLQVPYSDTLAMWVAPAILLIFLKARDAKNPAVKIILYFLIGFIQAVGLFLKPFTIIITIAILAFLLIRSFGNSKRFAAFLIAAAVICAGAFCAFGIYKTQIYNRFSGKINTSENMPFTHYLMMGLNVRMSEINGRPLYGAYSDHDFRITKAQPTKAKKVELNLNQIKQRLKDFGPRGYVDFLAKKADFVFGDGTFWADCEGRDFKLPSFSQNSASKTVQSIFRYSGKYYYWDSNIEQGVWTLMIFMLFVPLFLRRHDFRNDAIMVSRITVFGLLMYLLLFEARSRYLISFLPIITLLAAYGFMLSYIVLDDILASLRKKRSLKGAKT